MHLPRTAGSPEPAHHASGPLSGRAALVEDRRRLQDSLLNSGSALTVAGQHAPDRAGAYLEFERACTQLGYRILGVSWHPRLRADVGCVVDARDRYREIASDRLNALGTVQELGKITAAISDVFSRH